MASVETPDDDVERCMTALEAVSDVAMEHCTDPEVVQKAIGRFLGVEPDANCEAALAEGLNEETCRDFRGLRQWVLCRSHQLVDEEGAPMSTAVGDAWDEAKESCGNLAIDV